MGFNYHKRDELSDLLVTWMVDRGWIVVYPRWTYPYPFVFIII